MKITRPKINLLDESHKTQIFKEAKVILETLGVYIENEEVIELLNNRGIPHKENSYFIPSDVILKCLSSAPNEIKLYDRESEESLSLKNDNVHFNPGSAAIHILDEVTGERRHGKIQDFIKFSKILIYSFTK